MRKVQFEFVVDVTRKQLAPLLVFLQDSLAFRLRLLPRSHDQLRYDTELVVSFLVLLDGGLHDFLVDVDAFGDQEADDVAFALVDRLLQRKFSRGDEALGLP